MYNHYQGNTGQVRRVNDSAPPQRPGLRDSTVGPPAPAGPAHPVNAPVRPSAPPSAPPSNGPRPVSGPPPGLRRPPSPLSGLSGELGKLLGKLSHMDLETDDLLLLLILYLMYRESHDEELLFIMAAMFFL